MSSVHHHSTLSTYTKSCTLYPGQNSVKLIYLFIYFLPMPTGTQVLTDIQYQRRIARKSKIFKKKKLVPKPLQVTHFRRYARRVLDKRLYVPPHIQRSFTRICRNKFGASRSTVVKRLRNLLEEPGCLLTRLWLNNRKCIKDYFATPMHK